MKYFNRWFRQSKKLQKIHTLNYFGFYELFQPMVQGKYLLVQAWRLISVHKEITWNPVEFRGGRKRGYPIGLISPSIIARSKQNGQQVGNISIFFSHISQRGQLTHRCYWEGCTFQKSGFNPPQKYLQENFLKCTRCT